MKQGENRRAAHLHKLMPFLVALVLLFFPITALAAGTYDLVIHHIFATPKDGLAAYQVNIYLSVLDENGNLVKDLEAEDFTVSEGIQKVAVDSLEAVRNDPNHIVVAIDSSGSMDGENMNSAKHAVSEFIQDVETGDRVAVLSFQRDPTVEIDFTDSREDAQNAIEKIKADRNSDTCLYDAIYKAVEMLASQPAGRRAVVVLTDGVDETFNGGSCSVHTIDDVIDLASTGSTRAPIYTVGLGDRSDERNLERMAVMTGGRYRLSATRDDLEETFDNLTEQFRNEYLLRYTSTSAAGKVQLLVEVEQHDKRDQDTREFDLPELPVVLSIAAPHAGTELSGLSTITVQATGQNQIKEVVYYVNDTEIGRVSGSPYQLEYDFSSFSEGDYTIKTIARDQNGNDLTQQSVNIKIIAASQPEATNEITPTAQPSPSPTPGKGFLDLSGNTLILLGVGALGLLALVIVLIIVVVVIARRKKNEEEKESSTQVQPAEDRTLNGFAAPVPIARYGAEPQAMPTAILRVRASEDPMMIGHQINLTKARTTVGRGAENDMILPKDKAVSRHHAMIETTQGNFFLSEIVSQEGGAMRRPTYGTFVNGNKLGAMPVQLKTGDEIQLGTHFIMQFEKFESSLKPRSPNDRMQNRKDDDKTQIM